MVAATILLSLSTVSVQAYSFTLTPLGGAGSATATLTEGYGVNPDGTFKPGWIKLDSATAQQTANPANAFALLDNERPGRDDSFSPNGKPYADAYLDLIHSISNGAPGSNVHFDHWGYTEYYFSPYQYDPLVPGTYADYFESVDITFDSAFAFKLTVASDKGTPGPAQATVSVAEFGFNAYEWANYTLVDSADVPLFSWSLGAGDQTAQVSLEPGQDYYLYAQFGGGGGAKSHIGYGQTGFDENWYRTDYYATLDIDVSEGTGNTDPPGPNPDPVPEPISALLLALALPGLAAARRHAG